MISIESTRSFNSLSPQPATSEDQHILGNKIICIDDQTSFYELLCNFLKQELPQFEVMGLCRSAEDVKAAIASTRPDLLIMDFCLQNLNPREFIRKLKTDYPTIKILVMTHWKRLDTTRTLVNAGADGIVSKQESLKIICQAICTVSAGELFLSPSIKGVPNEEKPALSPREALALRLIADGYSTKEMADPLSISVKTAGKYRERIMAKLGLNDSIKLTQFAIRNGYYVL